MASGRQHTGHGPRDPKAGGPDGPTELHRTSWKAVLRRTFKEFQEDNATDWAAALTYYAIQSIFPALLVRQVAFGVGDMEVALLGE